MSTNNSDNDFLSDNKATSNTPSPQVASDNSEKKIKLDENAALTESITESKNDLENDQLSESYNPQTNSNLKIKLNGKDVDLLESSLNSSSLWTSTENSFVQVTDKLLHRGIQTDYLNNTNTNIQAIQPNSVNSVKSPSNVLMANHSNGQNPPLKNLPVSTNNKSM